VIWLRHHYYSSAGPLLSAKSLNIPLKSEFMSIDTLNLARMQKHLPGRVEARLSGLGLTEFQVEGSIHLLDSTSAFDEIGSHNCS